MPSGLFSFIRGPRPSTAGAEGPVQAPSTASPSPSLPDYPFGKKRRTAPPESGRSAAVVRRRWRQLDKEQARVAPPAAARPAAKAPAKKTASSYMSWLSRFSRLRLIRPGTVPEVPGAKKRAGGPDEAGSLETASVVARSTGGDGDSDSDAEVGDDSLVDAATDQGYLFPTPWPQEAAQPRSPQTVLHGGASAVKTEDADEPIPSTEAGHADTDDQESVYAPGDDSGDDDDSAAEDDTDWSAYFEREPPEGERGLDMASEWEIDADELAAYRAGVADIEGFHAWTRDEKQLHRLLSLRGFHPLMPATWMRDFLGVPLYPSLFAPPDCVDRPVVIYSKGSQFRATKALRSLFDLQARVSGLRQAGNTQRVDMVIEKELRRYIAWAAQDAGMDRCAPLVEMPNITAKRFASHHPRKPATAASGGRKKSLARRIEDYFREWAARYREYYAGLPAYPETTATAGATPAATTRRLRPPRLLYGFVVVQHAVMLLAVDAAQPRARPRCFANFNMSLGDHWLDASLNVAIPVHLARAAQMRCIQGLALPALPNLDADEDA